MRRPSPKNLIFGESNHYILCFLHTIYNNRKNINYFCGLNQKRDKHKKATIMKNNKKGIIILSAVAVVVAVGIVLSLVMDWPVDTNQTSGDIGKSVRYSNKVATEKLTNMEELLRTDTAFRHDIASAYLVMVIRARQFDALVNLSNEAAGDIEAYADLLKDMNAMRTTLTNVCTQIEQAGDDLGAAYMGEECPELEQNVINASLAYTTLQKQNQLADRFIETTDRYLKEHEASDELKLVRDSWMSYQQVTAALENDTKAAQHLEEQGYLLSNEQTLALLGMRDPDFHLSSDALGMRDPAFHLSSDDLLGRGPRNSFALMNGAALAASMHLNSNLAGSFNPDALNAVHANFNTPAVLNDVITATSLGVRYPRW